MPIAGSGELLFPIIKNEIRSVRSALWFRPTAFCLLASVVAVAVAVVDGFLPQGALDWLPEVDKSTVQELLNLMAGSMMTVATVTLSVLMLVFSLAAGQASPRAVPELMADRVTQNALGTFLATFVFSLTALLLLGFGAVAGPGVTLTFFCALLLVMNAVRYMVQWIHHVAETLKVNRMIHRIHRQAQTVLESYLAEEPAADIAEVQPDTGGEQGIYPSSTGYVQMIDLTRLHRLAEEADFVVHLCVREGDFVHPRRRLMTLRQDEGEGVEPLALQTAIVVGFERSHEGDPRLGFELLAEVACRALSPGINDPQSALACIEHLGGLLALAGEQPRRSYPSPVSQDGRIHFIRTAFDALLERAFRPVIRDGAASAEVICSIMGVLTELARGAAADYLDCIELEAQRAEDFGAAALTLKADRDRLHEMAERLRKVVADRRSSDGR